MAKKKTAAKKVVKKPAKKAAKKVAKKVATKVAKKVVTKVAKKVTTKAAKKVVKKVENRTEKKVVKKVENRTEKKVDKSPKPVVVAKTEDIKKVEKPTELTAQHTEPEEAFADSKGNKKLDKERVKKLKKATIEEIKESFAEEIFALNEEYSLKEIFETIRSTDFFNNETDECIEKGCDNPVTTGNYCRYHYISNWKGIKKRESILKEGKLQSYIEDLVEKYPIKYIESILNDLSDEKAFVGVLQDLDIDSGDGLDINDEDGIDDDQDIAFETKTTSKMGFSED